MRSAAKTLSSLPPADGAQVGPGVGIRGPTGPGGAWGNLPLNKPAPQAQLWGLGVDNGGETESS